MKLVFVCHGIGNGGAERVLVTLANYMCKVGNEVTVITTNPQTNEYSLVDGINYFNVHKDLRTGFQRVLYRIISLRKIICEINPDRVISFSATCNIQVLIALLVTKNKVIISERTDPSRFPEGMLYRALRKLLYPTADRIVFQTEEARNYFSRNIRKKSVIICNPVRENLPSPVIKRNKKMIIGVGALCEQKNWTVALIACDLFFRDHPEYTFEIYGDGDDRESLQVFIDNSDSLKNRAFLKGFSSEIDEIYKNAKIYISSSDYEGISNSMLEALAMGIPSICTDCPVGGARMVIQDGVNGFLVPVGGSDEMASVLNRLATDENLCISISEEAVKVRGKYNENSIAHEWIQLIKEV